MNSQDKWEKRIADAIAKKNAPRVYGASVSETSSAVDSYTWALITGTSPVDQMPAYTWLGNNSNTLGFPTDNFLSSLTEVASSVLIIIGASKALLNPVTIQVKQASSSQNGFLTSADWNTFNNKGGQSFRPGGWDASGDVFPTTGGSGVAGAIVSGDYWVITVAGTLGGVAVLPGDFITSLIDSPGQTSGNWNITSDSEKADKVIGAITGNLASLTNTGNLADSGVASTGNVTQISNDKIWTSQAVFAFTRSFQEYDGYVGSPFVTLNDPFFPTVEAAYAAGKRNILIVKGTTESNPIIITDNLRITIGKNVLWDIGDNNLQITSSAVRFFLEDLNQPEITAGGDTTGVKWSPTTSKPLIDMGGGNNCEVRLRNFQLDATGGTASNCPITGNEAIGDVLEVIGITPILLPNLNGYGFNCSALIKPLFEFIVFKSLEGDGSGVYDVFNVDNAFFPTGGGVGRIHLVGAYSSSMPIITTGRSRISVMEIIEVASSTYNFNIGGNVERLQSLSGSAVNITLTHDKAFITNADCGAGNIDINGVADVRLMNVFCNSLINENPTTDYVLLTTA